jgi:hypothetical protein
MAKELDHRTTQLHRHFDAEQEEGPFTTVTAHGLSHKASDIIRKDDDINDNDNNDEDGMMEFHDETASLLLLDKGDQDQEAQTSSTATATASSSLLIARGGGGRGGKGRVTSESESSVSASIVLERLKIGFYFALWYALNVVYK